MNPLILASVLDRKDPDHNHQEDALFWVALVTNQGQCKNKQETDPTELELVSDKEINQSE